MPTKKAWILSYLHVPTDPPQRRLQAAVAAVAMLGMVTAFAVAPDSLPESIGLEALVQPLPTAAVTLAGNDGLFLHEDRVRRSDTVASLLNRLGVDDPEALEFIRNDTSARPVARQMRPGKTVSASTDAHGRLASLHFPLNGQGDRVLLIQRGKAGFDAVEQVALPERQVVLMSGEIQSSLYAATDAAGIPDAIANQLAEIFAGEIDFHRDLRKGDRFAITYEVYRQRGEIVRPGRILAAEFTNAGQTLTAVHFAGSDGTGGYYDPQGKSLRKAFLRSPIEFSRVTSGFSKARFHPVLQEWRAHRGVDYGAPVGTRVRATGDGVVEFVGRQGGYGNLVVLRHAGGFATAYGHLSAFASGLRKGARVGQNELIGLVGQTGLASGPHLHYEFRVGNVQVNPMSVALPEAPPLDAQRLAEFRGEAKNAAAHLELARLSTNVAVE